MLAARALRLHIDAHRHISARSDLTASSQAIAQAVSMLESRQRAPWRALLHNLAPVHVHAPTAAGTTLSAARVSGLPLIGRLPLEPVTHHPRAITLFLARGDCYMVRMHIPSGSATVFVSLDYSLSPKIATSDAPMPMRSPIDSMPLHWNSTRLLELAFDRELEPVEAYIAATTMPTLWSRHGGRPLEVIQSPTPEQVRVARAFCQRFSAPEERIQMLRAQTTGWARALGDTHDQRAVAGFAAPISGKNDKQERQAKPGVAVRSGFLTVADHESIDHAGTDAMDNLPQPLRPARDYDGHAPGRNTHKIAASSATGSIITAEQVPPSDLESEPPFPSMDQTTACPDSLSRAVDLGVADTNISGKLTSTEDETQPRTKPRLRF